MSGAHSLAVHAVFDVLAWLSAAVTAWWMARRGIVVFPVERPRRLSYYAALTLGAAAGAYLFGTLNLIACGLPGVARSIEGALVGAILAIELYKRGAGLRQRTGARFALPLAVAIAVGRIGCFAAGLPDFTYGTPTSLPWAYDFGDGVPRHPVQLYESAAMAGFALVYLAAVGRGNKRMLRDGFYLCVGYYALQRFVWEIVKPYAPVLGPLTIFQLLSLALATYAAVMLFSAPNDDRPRARAGP